MAVEYDITPAVAGTKNKASVYNQNFTKMKTYVDGSISDLTSSVQSTLSIYQTVNTLANSGEIPLSDNSVNTINPQSAVTFTVPTISGAQTGKFHQILIQLHLTDTSFISAENEGLGTNYFYNGLPRFTIVGDYDIIYTYDNYKGAWCVGAIYKGEVV